jgi:FkbM family methyltransferase
VRARAADLVRRARRALARRELPVVSAHVGRLDYDGAEILVGVTSRTEILSRLRPAAKEPWTVRWLEESVRPGDVLYDVGANVGAYALIGASLGRGRVRVVAFEPGYASYAALCDNVMLNGLEDAVIPLPVVLGERAGLATLSYGGTDAGARTFSAGTTLNVAYRQPVLVHRLDDLVEQLDLPPPTLIKLDVDGAEGSVLAGGARTIARPELRSLLVEVERERAGDVVPLLEQAGLALRERIDERDGEPLRHVWYGIFDRAG